MCSYRSTQVTSEIRERERRKMGMIVYDKLIIIYENQQWNEDSWSNVFQDNVTYYTACYQHVNGTFLSSLCRVATLSVSFQFQVLNLIPMQEFILDELTVVFIWLCHCLLLSTNFLVRYPVISYSDNILAWTALGLLYNTLDVSVGYFGVSFLPLNDNLALKVTRLLKNMGRTTFQESCLLEYFWTSPTPRLDAFSL